MGGEGSVYIKKIIVWSSIIVFVVSVLVLAFLDSDTLVSGKISNLQTGKKVSIFGVVIWQKHINGYTIALVDTGMEKVRVFTKDTRELSTGLFTGVVKDYKGEKELVLDKTA